jgi:hypothetical protein
LDEPLEELSLEQLRERLREAEARLPAHSIRPAQIAEIEELEDEIARREAEGEG